VLAGADATEMLQGREDADHAVAEALFDALPDVMFFVKDANGRYLVVDQMSPLQLLHKLRLDEATRLLRETTLPLGEIALQTGWCDQSAFTRHFTRYAGIAPGRSRGMLRMP